MRRLNSLYLDFSSQNPKMVRWKQVTLLGVTFTIIWLLYSQNSATKPQCSQFPKNVLKYTKTWQIQKTQHGTLQLMSAFLDDRQKSGLFSKQYPTIRILGMLDNTNPQKFYCQIWYDKEDVAVVESSHFWIWNGDWEQAETFFQPFVFSCDTPDERIPKYVSLVANKCDLATNRLTVVYEKVSTKEDFVVCVKGLNFPHDDISIRLVEWIELVTLLGKYKFHRLRQSRWLLQEPPKFTSTNSVFTPMSRKC